MKIITTFVAAKDGSEDLISANGSRINIKGLETNIWSGPDILSSDEYRPVFSENTGTLEECLQKIMYEAYIVLFSSRYGRIPESSEDFTILRNLTYNF